MGFPEGWTAVDVDGAVMTDNARYKCIGNSMSVNVMRWIGRRLTQAHSRAPTESQPEEKRISSPIKKSPVQAS